MCDNNRCRCRHSTWLSNIVLVVVVAVTVTAPLFQHVACVPSAADILAVKRDVTNVDFAGSTEYHDNLKVDKNFGDEHFDAYINTFDMQDEASIPEDILDQQHIQDGDMQYATEPEATDIILISQRLNSRNFSEYGVNKNDKTNEKSKNGIFKTKLYDKNLKISNYTNKGVEFYDEMAIVDYDDEHDDRDEWVNNDSKDDDDDELATEVKADSKDIIKESTDMSSESAIYKNFKEKNFKKNGQQQNEQQRQHEQLNEENKQHQKQLHSIVKLNERKFNKVPRKKIRTMMTTTEPKANNVNTIKNSDSNNNNINTNNTNNGYNKKQQNTIWSFKEDGHDGVIATAVIAPPIAIGDIQDNFRNKDEAFAANNNGQAQSEDNFENDYGGNGDVVNDDNDSINIHDKSAAEAAIAATEQRSMDVKKVTGKEQHLTSAVIVGKKTKRFNIAQTLNSDEHKQKEMTLFDYEFKDNSNADTATKFKSQNDDTIKRYKLRPNGLNIFKQTQNSNGQQRQQQQQHEYAVEKENEENTNNGETEADYEIFHSTSNQYQKQQNLNHATILESAFEKHKARRRNNRRSGHKSHKKRYKDYFRFAMTPLETPTTIMVPLVTTTTLTATTKTETAIKNTNEQIASAAIVAAATQTFANGTNKETEPATIATLAELTNNSKRIYKNKHESDIENFDKNVPARRVEKLRKYARKLEAEKSRGLPASPIFAVANRNSVSTQSPPIKPFYEGQINYYMETKDDEPVKSSIALTDTSNWYRRVSPVLRNGIKTTVVESNEPVFEHRNKQKQHNQHHHHQYQQKAEHKNQHHQHQQQHHLNHHHHHQHQHQPHTHNKHKQTNKQYQSAQSNPYQRKLVRKPAVSNNIAATYYSTPIPPPAYKPHDGAMQELGHQITEMEELERYYAKWPHLARVQLQVYDEHFREEHPEIYPDYDQEYESAAELEEAQNGNSEDANLPPYIKKYNRRNKQLLNLLEGTLPPLTKTSYYTKGQYASLLQPGPHESSNNGQTIVRIDDDYMKEKRRRYHNRYGNGNHNDNKNNNAHQHDLFVQQRNAVNSNENLKLNTTVSGTVVSNQQKSSTVTQKTILPSTSSSTQSQTGISVLQNQLPDENVSITQEEQQQNDNSDDTDWQEEIETKSSRNIDNNEMTGNAQMTWQIEKLTTPPSSSSPSLSRAISTTTMKPKSALFRLPSYPAISGSYMGKPQSRSSHFAPSSRGNTYINMHKDNYNLEKTKHTTTKLSNTSTYSSSSSARSTTETITTPSKTINSFVYHRVVDSAPRFVGAGSTGMKQRLPFVAITDRRLETAKKTLLEHEKDLEQNFYPMP